MYVCLYVFLSVFAYVPVHIWRWKNQLLESVLSCYHAGYVNQIQVVKLGGKYPYMMNHHTIPSTALLVKKNTDAINWILQFILKLNFYILTNAKCQLYSIINDSFLTLKFLRASLIYFPLVAMIDPITVYVSLSFWTHNYWSFIVCDLSRLASFTSWVDGG